MTININESYLASLVSQMTYADGLVEGMTGDQLAEKIVLELDDKGVTQAQATYFANKWGRKRLSFDGILSTQPTHRRWSFCG